MKVKRLSKKDWIYQDSINKVRDFQMEEEHFLTFVSNPNNLAYYILEEEKVVAFAWGYVLERMDAASMLYIHSVDVLEGYRRKGYGRELIARFLDFARENGFRNTFLITDKDNFEANKLYQSFSHEKEEDKNLYIFKEEKVEK